MVDDGKKSHSSGGLKQFVRNFFGAATGAHVNDGHLNAVASCRGRTQAASEQASFCGDIFVEGRLRGSILMFCVLLLNLLLQHPRALSPTIGIRVCLQRLGFEERPDQIHLSHGGRPHGVQFSHGHIKAARAAELLFQTLGLCAVNNATDPRPVQCTGAHDAGFGGCVDGALGSVDCFGQVLHFANQFHFGVLRHVRATIAAALNGLGASVLGRHENLSCFVVGDASTKGHAFVLVGLDGFCNGHFHARFVVGEELVVAGGRHGGG
mmetsp:Transcript_13934/g.30457  ORF Transcript_13934/g.30457 Transcript_13934/m.30457 type:complete len:266 (-) Transcript_13934:148-945(-)